MTERAPRLVVARFAAMGDCAMAYQALRWLKHHHPEVELTWMIDPRFAAVTTIDGPLGATIVMPPRKPGLFGFWSWSREIKNGYAGTEFDFGIDLHSQAKTAVAMRAARPARLLGVSTPDRFVKALQRCQPARPGEHQVEEFVRALNRFFPLPPPSPSQLSALAQSGTRKGGVVIATGAGHPGKIVPISTLEAVARSLVAAGETVAYAGTAGDPAPNEWPGGTVNLLGRQSLPQLIETIRNAALVISGDTGAGHLAASMNTPVLSLWGFMPEDRFRPYTPFGKVINRGGDPAKISPEEVLELAFTMLARKVTR